MRYVSGAVPSILWSHPSTHDRLHKTQRVDRSETRASADSFQIFPSLFGSLLSRLYTGSDRSAPMCGHVSYTGAPFCLARGSGATEKRRHSPRNDGERSSGSLQPLSNATIISKPRRSDTTRIRFTVYHRTAGHDDHMVTFTTALRRLDSTSSTAFASVSVLHDVERPPLIEQPDNLAVLVINNNAPRFPFYISRAPLQTQRIDNSTCLLSLYTV